MGGKLFNTETQEANNTRYGLDWRFGERAKPGLNADIQNALEATRMIADRHFEVLGQAATSASTTMYAEGGVVLTTGAAGNDQVIILPHLDANQTAWAQTTWGTDRQTEWECWLATGGDISTTIIWAGLKLTNTADPAIDADQVYFRYENGVAAGNFQAINSIATVVVSDDTGVVVAIDTYYHLKISILPNRVAQCYIDDVLVSTSLVLTDVIDLIPYVGVQGTAAAARAMRLMRQKISRLLMAA